MNRPARYSYTTSDMTGFFPSGQTDKTIGVWFHQPATLAPLSYARPLSVCACAVCRCFLLLFVIIGVMYRCWYVFVFASVCLCHMCSVTVFPVFSYPPVNSRTLWIFVIIRTASVADGNRQMLMAIQPSTNAPCGTTEMQFSLKPDLFDYGGSCSCCENDMTQRTCI